MLVFHESVGYVTWLSREADKYIRQCQTSYEQIRRCSKTGRAKDGGDNQNVRYNGQRGCNDVDDSGYQVHGVTLGSSMEGWIRKMETVRAIDRDVVIHLAR